MSERISSYPKIENSERQYTQALEHIGKKALRLVDRTYGKGFPEWTKGERELAYHNGRHSRLVGSAALRLCSSLGMSRLEQSIAQTAGFAHDIIHAHRRGQDEAESAAWLDDQLEEKGSFPSNLRRMGTLAIVGTEPTFKNGILTGQRASVLEYPDKATELVAKSVASADLGTLYTPEGPYQAHQLLREIKAVDSPDTITPDAMTDFQRNQLALLESYRYPLKKADRVLATHRRQVMDFSKQTLKMLETGDIESWHQLIERDLLFFRGQN